MADGISEESSKKKRGRPSVIPPKVLADFKVGRADVGPRCWQNDHYAYMAIHALGCYDRSLWRDEYAWLFERVAVGRQWALHWHKKSILTELGRIGDNDLIRECAAILCREKPKTREAIVRIRRFRLGQDEKAGDSQSLTHHLARSLDDYLSRYPATTDTEIMNAIRILMILRQPDDEDEETDSELPEFEDNDEDAE